MKTMTLILSALVLCLSATARTVTLVTTATIQTNQVTIGSNEVARAIYFVDPNAAQSERRGYVVLQIGESKISYGYGTSVGTPEFTVAGPATITLIDRGLTGESMALLTLEIEPSYFPPDKTIVIPSGAGANIALECSTNLIDWASASPGVYTNVPSHKFFRIRAERLE